MGVVVEFGSVVAVVVDLVDDAGDCGSVWGVGGVGVVVVPAGAVGPCDAGLGVGVEPFGVVS